MGWFGFISIFLNREIFGFNYWESLMETVEIISQYPNISIFISRNCNKSKQILNLEHEIGKKSEKTQLPNI